MTGIRTYQGLRENLRARFRIDGVLHDIMSPARQIHAPLLSRLKIMANMNIAERRISQDGRMTLKIEGKVINVRAASLPASRRADDAPVAGADGAYHYPWRNRASRRGC